MTYPKPYKSAKHLMNTPAWLLNRRYQTRWRAVRIPNTVWVHARSIQRWLNLTCTSTTADSGSGDGSINSVVVVTTSATTLFLGSVFVVVAGVVCVVHDWLGRWVVLHVLASWRTETHFCSGGMLLLVGFVSTEDNSMSIWNGVCSGLRCCKWFGWKDLKR